MALQVISAGGKVALGIDTATGERGFLLKMLNKTGVASVKGTVVAASAAVDNSVVLSPSGFDVVGVVQEAGVADDAEMWVWTSGSTCQVLLTDETGATRGQVALASDTDGRIYVVDVPSANPAVAEHFREVGHVMQTVAAPEEGAALVLCSIHFN